MWHILHLIATPIEFLLGVFCILTAIMLYPNEEGQIQSKLQDFWIRVDDYKQVALSGHTRFMQEVARLETVALDRLFGGTFSIKSVVTYFCLSVASISIAFLSN